MWAFSSLHAPVRVPPAKGDQAWLSEGPWGAPPPPWPLRPSQTTASPGGRHTQGPRQRLAGVGVALGGLSGAVPWLPGSTHAPGPEGKKVGRGCPTRVSGRRPFFRASLLGRGTCSEVGPLSLRSWLPCFRRPRTARLWRCLHPGPSRSGALLGQGVLLQPPVGHFFPAACSAFVNTI